ncbi:MAG TPA: hypothetical protein VGV86_03820 [Acidimicrobiales bacterium]|nr:hypothetical protein [Acidimicrobiales bacterium]
MSGFDGVSRPISVTVTAEKNTEIFVIDGAFNLRARGVGRVDEKLEPGLYKLKFRSGPLVQEMHEVVEAGQGPFEFTCPPLEFASPAPLAQTSTTHGYQEEAAAELSRQVHRRIGTGSQIFLFARCYTGKAFSSRPKVDDPARGLTLHDLEGRLLVDFEHDARAGAGSDASAGCTVELAPGAYRLRGRTERWGALEQMIVASAGWQTQVFLWQTDDDGRRVPDLSGTCVLLAELGTGFSPDSGTLRSSELARVALAERRVFMPRHQLREMLGSEVDNPMVGIYASHALVSAGEADRDLLTAVTDKLRQLLGEHPDVEALRLHLDGAAGTPYRFQAPPMLASSWSLVLAASEHLPELVPRGSLAARASTALWGDGPWLIWMADGFDDEAWRTERTLGAVLGRIAEVAPSMDPDEIGIPRAEIALSAAEEALLSAVSPLVRSTQESASSGLMVPTGPAADVPGTAPAPSSIEATLAARLGVPLAALDGLAARLLSKLESQGGTEDRSDPEEASR